MLLSDLFDLLQQAETDMTLFFRGLMAIPGGPVSRHDGRTRAWGAAAAGVLR